MNLRNAFKTIISNKNTIQILNYIGNNEARLEELLNLFFEGESVLSQRSASVIVYYAEKKSWFLKPYLKKMIAILEENPPVVISRNILRFLRYMHIPEEMMGKCYNICYEFVGKRETPIAIKAFSMAILYNICKKEPDLKPELIELITLQLDYGQKGVIPLTR